jgi:hypothetical protein
MITPGQHAVMRADIGSITDRSHLELKIRVLTVQIEALISASRVRSLQPFTADDADELRSDLAVHVDLMEFAVMRLRGLP